MKGSIMLDKRLGYGLALVFLLVAPHFAYPLFLMTVLCFALFACALNLIMGFAGMVSFGHAAFFGGSAYIAGYVLASYGWPFEVGMLAGTAAGALMGMIVGVLAARRTGIYFAMITLALAQMMYFIYLKAPFTGGEDGLQAIPRGKLLGIWSLKDDITYYYVLLTYCLLGWALIVRTVHSHYGQVLRAIKENEARALSLGYDVTRYKLLAFVISAALSGLAGSLKAVAIGVATLTDVQWTMSGLVLLMVMVGGMKTFVGPAVGALVIITLQIELDNFGHYLADVTQIDWFSRIGVSIPMVTGLIFIASVLLFREGIVGSLKASRHRLQRKGARHHG
ncbi:branched-chain amino acid ABC transporter permease [Castellaniella sp. GW247-6E4]|uniref:branched-chain amino acid ABC transporter permease n=1 Tax=Castellaniella sp. GW247-6E4 TaxID=3140380 RepID=UPI003314B22F